MIPKLFVTEYSKSQDAFHVHDIYSMLQTNVRTISNPHISDYLVIGVFATEQEAREYANVFRKAMENKAENWVDSVLKRIVG